MNAGTMSIAVCDPTLSASAPRPNGAIPMARPAPNEAIEVATSGRPSEKPTMRVMPSGKCKEIPKPLTNNPENESTGVVEIQNAVNPTSITAYDVSSKPSAP